MPEIRSSRHSRATLPGYTMPAMRSEQADPDFPRNTDTAPHPPALVCRSRRLAVTCPARPAWLQPQAGQSKISRSTKSGRCRPSSENCRHSSSYPSQTMPRTGWLHHPRMSSAATMPGVEQDGGQRSSALPRPRGVGCQTPDRHLRRPGRSIRRTLSVHRLPLAREIARRHGGDCAPRRRDASAAPSPRPR